MSQSSTCGSGVGPYKLASAVTTNGCSLASGATSGCPSPLPSGKTMDAMYMTCQIAQGASDCTLSGAPYVECPAGEIAGPLTIRWVPASGQAGYGESLDLRRTYSNGVITIDYDTWEVGVRADGTIAWEGPHAHGTEQVSATSCCEELLTVAWPASGYGEKVLIDLEWF